jgi:hypothetical protein
LGVSLATSFVATAKAANKSTHRRSRSSSLAGVTGYSAANCTQRLDRPNPNNLAE